MRRLASSPFLLLHEGGPSSPATRLLHGMTANAKPLVPSRKAHTRSTMELVSEQPVVVRTEQVEGLQLSGGGVVFTHRTVVPEVAPPARPRLVLSDGEVDELRKLRAEDPSRWTVRRLAARFDVPTFVVGRLAPLSAETQAQRNEEKEVAYLKQVFKGYRPRSRFSSSTPAANASSASPPSFTSLHAMRAAAAEALAKATPSPKKHGSSIAEQDRINKAKFDQMLTTYDRGLKEKMKKDNIVPKRPPKGRRKPPLIQVEEKASVLKPDAFQLGVATPELDFTDIAEPKIIPTKDEKLRKQLIEAQKKLEDELAAAPNFEERRKIYIREARKQNQLAKPPKKKLK
jgi:hypothetical protein